jgi:hypothetical protein
MALVRNRSIFVSVVLAVVLASAAAGAAQAKTPEHRSFRPANLALSFQLPSDWSGGPGRGRESKFFAVAPGRVANFEILAGPTKLSADAFASAFVSGERDVVLSGDARAAIVNRGLVVGEATPATEIVATYRGIGDVSQRPGERLSIVLYGFVHEGKAYILQFTTTDTWLPKLRGEFRFSAKSVRFPFVT